MSLGKLHHKTLLPHNLSQLTNQEAIRQFPIVDHFYIPFQSSGCFVQAPYWKPTVAV